MTILNIVKYPNELLHQKSEPVKVFDKRLKKLVADMFETMYKNDGIGLAAVQVGVLQDVIVIDVNHEDIVFKSEIINPKIISFSSERSTMAEGCLSVAGRQCNVVRPTEVEVEYYTLDGKKHNIEAKGLLAKCFQHEIDHTNGITIVDREKEQM